MDNKPEEAEQNEDTENGTINANEDVIEKCTGSLGKWHIRIFILACVLKIPIAWYQLNIIFISPPVDFSCAHENVINNCSDECKTYNYDKSVFTNTIVSEWNLVCNREYLQSLAQTVTMAGILFGNFIFGYLSDRYGRRITLLIAILIQSFSGILIAFNPWLSVFLVLRYCVGLSLGGTTVTSFVVVMETVGVKWRTLLALLYQVAFNLGQMLLPLFSFLLRDWRDFELAISVPTILLATYYWLLPESPRWQLAAGKTADAIKTLEKAAKTNKLSTKDIEKEINSHIQRTSNNDKQIKKPTIFDLFRTPVIRRYTLILWLNWFCCGISFFGVSQFVGQLGGNIFINVASSAVLQLPGALFCCWSIQAWGRKKTMVFGNGLAGLSLLAAAIVPSNPVWIKPVLASIGLSALNTSFGTIYVYGGEIFPTSVRNLGVGTASVCSRLGATLAPFVANSSATFGIWIPPTIFGGCMLISALFCFKLPETLNCKLPETVEEVEQLKKRIIDIKLDTIN